MNDKRNGLTYADSGVDIDAGNAWSSASSRWSRATARPGADAEIGGFGGLFDLKARRFQGSGAGRRHRRRRHQAEGRVRDRAARHHRHRPRRHCVNDILVQGAEPLFFLDYFACGKLDADVAGSRSSPASPQGCRQRRLRADRRRDRRDARHVPGRRIRPRRLRRRRWSRRGSIIDGRTIAPGDVVIGLASIGLHTNGYSLVRKIVRAARAGLDAPAPFTPARRSATRCWRRRASTSSPACADARDRASRAWPTSPAAASPTTFRACCPTHLGSCASTGAAGLQVFDWLQRHGGVAEAEMHRVFNCGIGMVSQS